jgi:diguanylate cyclase (GGDEF)-like protein
LTIESQKSESILTYVKDKRDGGVQAELLKRAAEQSFRTLLGGPFAALAIFLSLRSTNFRTGELLWTVLASCLTLGASLWCRTSLRKGSLTLWRYRGIVGMAATTLIVMPVVFHPSPNSRQAALEVVSVALCTIVLSIMTAADRPTSYTALVSAIGVALFTLSALKGLPFFLLIISAVAVFLTLAPLIETVYQPLRRIIDLLFTNAHLMEDLQRANEGLSVQVITDSLTGLANRVALEKGLEQERVLGVLYLDLDHFKTVNDTHGHATGDEVLVRIANILRRCTRENDLVARLGGDEFVILLDQAKPSFIEEVAQRIRSTVYLEFVDFGISVSIGATVGDLLLEPGALALARADRNLYQAKQSGRNQVLVR